MPKSYTRLLYHVVFSTKHREPLITESWAADLYSYLGGIVRDRRGDLIAAGGVADHIHLLVRLAADRALSDVVRDIKAVSSGWRHEHGDSAFWWQTGYGAFTVSESGIEAVSRYIAYQPEHHRKMSFRDEYVALLRKHQVEYDERDLWE